jgi:predicted outer membrane repeat protein
MTRLVCGLILALLPALFAAPPSTATATLIYVDQNATGIADGSSWEDAFIYLQNALYVATEGDEIHVAAGSYRPDRSRRFPDGSGRREATFSMRSGVALRGSYAGGGAPDPDLRSLRNHTTILSGDLAGDDRGEWHGMEENAYHVVTGAWSDETALLDGFLICAGNADGEDEAGRGGGLYADTDGKIENCRFVGNRAIQGGAIACRSTYCCVTCPSFRYCSIMGNMAVLDGGGMLVSDSFPTMSHCRVCDNEAGRNGGGQMVDMDAKPHFRNCFFCGNRAGGKGGAFYGNFSFDLLFENCTLANNHANLSGGALYLSESSETCNLRSSILWGNSPDAIVYDIWRRPWVAYCDIQGSWPGAGNIDLDPLFADHGEFSCLLSPGSPAIDSGDPATPDQVHGSHPLWPPWFTDGPRCDMGATGGPENGAWARMLR